MTSLTRGVSRRYVPAIRVAIRLHKRPTAVIMQDDWYGHRDWLTWKKRGDKDEWTKWDFALVNALQTIEDFSDDNGILAWEKEDDNAVIDAVKKIDPFREAVEDRTSGKNYKAANGEYFVPHVYAFGDTELQTFGEWISKPVEDEEPDDFSPD